jgi:copper(I)-binding protein
MQLKNGLAEGDAVPVELNFERAGDIEVLFPVESIGAAGPATAPQNGAGMHSMPGHGHGQSQ